MLKPGARPDAKTCSPKCRSKRSRRVTRARKRDKRGITLETGIGAEALAELSPSGSLDPKRDRRVKEILATVFQDEFRPIVRESITDDTLRAIQGMVALTPLMVEKIGEDLNHPDPAVRGRAYTVMARYTLGHQAIVTPPKDEAHQQLTVNFAMPRPESTPTSAEAEAPAELEQETRECEACGAEKPASQFVEHSDRCTDCHESLRARLEGVLEKGDGVA